MSFLFFNWLYLSNTLFFLVNRIKAKLFKPLFNPDHLISFFLTPLKNYLKACAVFFFSFFFFSLFSFLLLSAGVEETNLEVADLSCLNWLDSCNRTPPSLNLFIWLAAAIWPPSAGSDVGKPASLPGRPSLSLSLWLSHPLPPCPSLSLSLSLTPRPLPGPGRGWTTGCCPPEPPPTAPSPTPPPLPPPPQSLFLAIFKD